ncbi:unnamed protein product [Effrenium voratum]|nr:unnamed protein product [Effrenium voratum]
MVIKAHIKKLKPYKPPLEGRNPHKYVLLDFNERTMEVPDFVKTALKDFIDNGGLQKYPSYGNLQGDIAAYCGVKTEEVMFTNGSDQGIDLVMRCCCEKGSEVIIPSPTFAMYEQAAESEGLVIRRPHFSKEKGFPLEEVLAMVSPKTSLIVLSNPNNPTGTEIPREAIMRVVKEVTCAVLVDECYFEFMDPATTVAKEVGNFSNLFVCRTFSKTWGIPSLRLGYLMSAAANIDAVTCVRGPYDINQLAVVGIQAAMKDSSYVYEYVKEVMERSKPMFEKFLEKRGIGYWPTVANFIFCYFPDPPRLEEGPKKDANDVVGLRVSFGTEEQMKRVISALEEREVELAETLRKARLTQGNLRGEPPARELSGARQTRATERCGCGLHPTLAMAPAQWVTPLFDLGKRASCRRRALSARSLRACVRLSSVHRARACSVKGHHYRNWTLTSTGLWRDLPLYTPWGLLESVHQPSVNCAVGVSRSQAETPRGPARELEAPYSYVEPTEQLSPRTPRPNSARDHYQKAMCARNPLSDGADPQGEAARTPRPRGASSPSQGSNAGTARARTISGRRSENHPWHKEEAAVLQTPRSPADSLKEGNMPAGMHARYGAVAAALEHTALQAAGCDIPMEALPVATRWSDDVLHGIEGSRVTPRKVCPSRRPP